MSIGITVQLYICDKSVFVCFYLCHLDQMRAPQKCCANMDIESNAFSLVFHSANVIIDLIVRYSVILLFHYSQTVKLHTHRKKNMLS